MNVDRFPVSGLFSVAELCGVRSCLLFTDGGQPNVVDPLFLFTCVHIQHMI